MTLIEALRIRDDALMEILDRMKGKKLYNNLWVQLRFFWQETKRTVYYATPWKDAQGNDLPEIDREVIALLNNGKVVFAHRPSEYWDGKIIIYDKGGWNIPDVKFWLDCQIPNIDED